MRYFFNSSPGGRLLLLLAFWGSSALGAEPILSVRNTEAPFCYRAGGTRSWPIASRQLEANEQLILTARPEGQPAVSGAKISAVGLQIGVSRRGCLEIVAPESATGELQLELSVRRGSEPEADVRERQLLSVRPAPPDRPLSYVSDLVDDLIRIFWDDTSRQFRPVTRDGFDQYFRRLQAQGITRLIVWQSPCPLIADPANYTPEDWSRFERQARAILNCEELNRGMRETAPLKSYEWLGLLMRLRLDRDFGQLFAHSAKEHGIKLSASFRPFEAALTKYYEVPAFDADGDYLWGFLPGASPAVNYHPDQVSFAHYRELLRRSKRPREAALKSIAIAGVADPAALAARSKQGVTDLEIYSSPVPPLDETSFVLVRSPQDAFQLVRFATVRKQVESRRTRLSGFRLRAAEGRLLLDDLRLPDDGRFLLIRSASDTGAALELPAVLDVTLRSAAGNRLGRCNVYCSLNGSGPAERATRVAGIPADGMYHTEFQAIEASVDWFRQHRATSWRLGDGTLVIDRGAEWSVEMTDFNRRAARQFVVRELKSILSHDAFDELFINTRSHTQLAGSTADGDEGILPLAAYRLKGKTYFHYGMDLAYGPLEMAVDPEFGALAAGQIATWQLGEWQGPGQDGDRGSAWRRCRNRAVAAGIRKLLLDLEAAFPETRIRAVIPHREAVINRFGQTLDELPKPEGGVYGRDYYRHVWSSLNLIPANGEAMGMVDLTGTSVEPVFLGVRFAPDLGPLNAFVDQCVEDLADRRGSRFDGPKSFFYEAQETLRGANRAGLRKRREAIIRDLLRRPAINEVLLYEAADWAYLPLSDRPLSSHAFLDPPASSDR